MGLSTRAMHGDTETGKELGREVAPNISVTTTFRHPTPAQAKLAGEWDPQTPDHDIYSRYTQPTLTRAEQALSAVIGAPTLMLPSGIAAVFVALLHYRPDVIAITDGYHGCHGAIEVYSKVRPGVKVIKLDDEFPTGERLLCWVETPLNPTGESRSIANYAKKTHAVGGTLFVDSTFGPPPLQDPFAWGADCVMHSATKYFAGHSDALGGTLSVKEKADWMALWHIRTYTGKQMSAGPATFAILLAKESYATHLAHQLQLFTAATSLGGVESLIEQRLVSDPGAHPCLVGIEDFEDLKADLVQGFRKVVQMDRESRL
ncbi:hypothetical protein RQP46_004801 [Phenoliferia psychrophenolica]